MTVRTLIFCSTCPRSEDAEGSKARGWGTLSTVAQGTVDICATCIANLHGWKPVGVANAGLVPIGRRVVEIHAGAAL